MNMHNFHITSTKRKTPKKHKLTIYRLMLQHNNVILDQHKLIEQIITLFTLHSNYLTIFISLLYQALMNKC
jgi:hypothetical protein